MRKIIPRILFIITSTLFFISCSQEAAAPTTEPETRQIVRAQGISLDRQATANWALAHWNDTSYSDGSPYYADNDCSNFVSKALQAGGLGNPTYPVVNDLVNYLLNNNIGVQVRAIDLELGDVIAIQQSGGTVPYSHIMVVTRIDSSGNAYYSGHTDNDLNHPVSWLQNGSVPTNKITYIHIFTTEKVRPYGWNPGTAWPRLIMDNDQSLADGQGFEKLGRFPAYWWVDGSDGSGGTSLYTYSDSQPDQNFGKWSTYVDAGMYDVYAYIPWVAGNADDQGLGNGYAGAVRYKVQNFDGSQIYSVTEIDQSANAGSWMKIGGGYVFPQGARVAVQLGDNVSGPANKRIYFDDVAFFRTGSIPTATWALSPSALTLPPGVVGGVTSSATYTATNTGNLRGTANLSATGGFTLSQPSVSLDPSQSFNMTVTAPVCSSPVTQSGVITMSDGGGGTATLNVSRVCTQPVLPPAWTSSVLTGSGLAISNGTVGGTTASSLFTVTNSGGTRGTATLSATNGFTLSPSSVTLDSAQKSGDIQVTAPVCASINPQTATVTITGDGSTATFNVTRTCLSPLPAAWEFSQQSRMPPGTVGTPSTIGGTFVVTNTGGQAATGTFTTTGGFTVSQPSVTLNPGQASPILTVYAPACKVPDNQTGTLSITSAGSVTAKIDLVRSCYEGTPGPWVFSSAPTLAAGVVGGTTASGTFTLTNSGFGMGGYTPTATNGFTVTKADGTPAGGTIAAGEVVTLIATAPVCTKAETQTSVITFAGADFKTLAVSRLCTLAPPLTPASLAVTMSSNGRLFVSWPVSVGATVYTFAGTFDGQTLNVSGSAPAPSGDRGSAVAVMVSTPGDPAKQGKALCLQVSAANAGGASPTSPPACATYQYYASTGISGQSVGGNDPLLKLILP